MCRASAATYWQAGVDGLYLWNNHVIEFFRDSDYDRQPWKEIGDPAAIASLNKHYLVDNPFDWDVMTEELGAPSVPPGPLPIALEKPGDSAEVPIDIADDVQTAIADGLLSEATLRVMIVNLSCPGRCGLCAERQPARRRPCPPEAAVQRLLARVRRHGNYCSKDGIASRSR